MTRDAEAARLELTEVSCAFGPVQAVACVSLAIREGEFVSLLGPSGCGKTTTLRMIAGFVAPTGGTISMDGEIISAPGACLPPSRRKMSMIFQSYAVWPNMTVAENVAFGLGLRKLDREMIRAKVDAMLRTVRLDGLAERYPGELSGGQQQRVALARAIVVEPKVLLMDEPLSNLDSNLREEMRFEIRRLHDTYRFTTVYVTHDQGEAMVTSDRIAVMNEGRIEQVDLPYELYTKPRTRFVAGFVGRTNFLEGTIAGDNVVFDGFTLPRRAFAPELAESRRKILFSLRPHSIALRRGAAAAAEPGLLSGSLVGRAFLGDAWDYTVAPLNSGLCLKVSAPPTRSFEVGETLLIQLDLADMAVIE